VTGQKNGGFEKGSGCALLLTMLRDLGVAIMTGLRDHDLTETSETDFSSFAIRMASQNEASISRASE
jgi:hypothetical protein